ncbi:MAG TPA: STAS domain-containing protein [Stenomitos sp.]
MIKDSICIIKLSGIFDGTKANTFHGDVRRALNEGADIILADCQELGFMDSSGLGAMIVALKMIRAAGKRFCLCAINKQVSMLFDLTDTRRVFEIFDTQDEFNAQMSQNLRS